MLRSGIDLHKRTLVIATVTPHRQSVQDPQLPTTRAVVRAYFAALPGPHRAVVESTSNWYWFRDLRVGAGVDLRLGHSKCIKAISYAKVKTDAVGAATLAQLLRAAPAALPALVQVRTTMLAEQFALLGAQAKRLAAELNPVLIPTADVQRLLWVPGWSPAAGSCRAPATPAGRPSTSVPRTATGT